VKKKNRALEALKKAANAIGNSKKDPLYGFFQKINRKHGRVYAIKATANKLATIIYNMATKKEAFNYMNSRAASKKNAPKKSKRCQKNNSKEWTNSGRTGISMNWVGHLLGNFSPFLG